MSDVHTTHCCIEHGCKYGDDDCHVANGSVPQEYPCEECGMEGINSLEELKFKQEASVMEIHSTDQKFMTDLIDFFNAYKVKPDSTVLRVIK